MTQIEHQLVAMAQYVPVEIFCFFGAMIEEIVAPIPSPIVMTVTGSIAEAQGHVFSYLFWLALIGAVGKTFGAWVVYMISDKAEDIVIGKLGKFLGVTHKEVESIGKHFSGGWKDDVILFVARALPIMPTAPVSIVAGVIKINMRTYIVSTFLGVYVRNMLYLYLGFAGLSTYQNLLGGLDSLESIMQVLMVGVVIGAVAFAYYKRSKGDFLANFKQKFKL
jgi:membrane protein DedA with SNARE-associated domain